MGAMGHDTSGFCIYEEELRDLMTYQCGITGRKRCPPFRSENLGSNKATRNLGVIFSTWNFVTMKKSYMYIFVCTWKCMSAIKPYLHIRVLFLQPV